MHVEFVMDEDFYNEALARGETPDEMVNMLKKEFDGDPNVVVDVATVTVQDDPAAAGVV